MRTARTRQLQLRAVLRHEVHVAGRLVGPELQPDAQSSQSDTPSFAAVAARPPAFNPVQSSYCSRRLPISEFCQRLSEGRRGSPRRWARATDVSREITVYRDRLASRREGLRSGPRGDDPAEVGGAVGGAIKPPRTRSARQASISVSARPIRGGDSSATTRSRSYRQAPPTSVRAYRILRLSECSANV
jgi:hypothetical protein